MNDIQKKHEEIINLVKRQTDYSEDVIKEKLESNNYNYMLIIEEYLGITKENCATTRFNNTDEDKTVNQQIYSNIRHFMDNNIKQYENRKKRDEYIQSLSDSISQTKTKIETIDE